ncbi:LysR substrate-binding domain-containing protein [Roseospirillum parvum]|uniref:DNA-binding transcriptional regulator, LysR family n=1 Tax=Roseospirillum parvum TaxID=83401 RepID=A0A1G7XUS1_9PROT|nr:LysR substrate-binding domain-containing protein [Roseospirillum parvum]SDG87826.1 DNA-binding transcriptional regulator, LysR family [Roseospirillum parvum]
MTLSQAQIRAFNAVVHHGGFTAAATALEISQPAVTAQVRQLEEAYGVSLFERLGREVRLTAVGEQLYRLTGQVADLEEAADSLLKGQEVLAGQVVKISTATPQLCMPLVAAFAARHPRTKMEVTLGNSGEAVARLLDSAADVAIAPVLHQDERLSSLILDHQHLCVVMPIEHRLALASRVTLEMVTAHPLIQRLGPSATQRLVDKVLKGRGLRTRTSLWLSTREAVYEAVAAGLGLALVLHRDCPPDSRLYLRRLADVEETVTERLVWVTRRARLPGVRAFIRLAEEETALAGGLSPAADPTRADPPSLVSRTG